MMTSFTRAGLLCLLVACAAPSAAEPPAAPPPAAAPRAPRPDAYWIRRTDAELDLALRDACAASRSDGRPVLLVFSAPWCGDCQVLERMGAHPPLAEEYGRWHRVIVDVGNFDRHTPLRQAFRVAAIAHVVALRPDDCSAPPPAWPRLKEGSMEPATGAGGPKTADDVLAWLVEARAR